jgi:hypothetical protein
MSVGVVLAMWLAAAPPCVAPSVVTLGWKEGAAVESVAEWVTKTLCIPTTVDPSAKGTKFSVGLTGKVAAADVHGLLSSAALASGLMLSGDASAWTLARLPEEAKEQQVCRDAAAALRVVSETERKVSRRVFESPWAACTANAARVVPSMEGGELSGLRLFAIRAQSVWAAAGFLNGDVLRSVNGLPLLEPDQVLAAREKLQHADKLDFLVKRRDALVHVVITIE